MTHASVFSGIGGPEVAASMLGWQNLFHVEINPFGKRVLDYWYPNAESYDDITKTNFTKWRGRVDVLTGGFPCQPFSYAGRRKGADDDRYLLPHMFRCIDEILPTWVVAENVAGITTMVEQGKVSEVASQATLFGEGDTLHRYQLRETFTLERICTDLESHGYSVQPILIPACAVGAPHRRDRVFIIARRIEAVSENTMHGGQLHRQDEVEGSERNIGDVGAGGGERICGETSRTASADSPCGGEGAPRTGESVEGGGCDTNQQQSERRATSEWNHRLHAVLRPSTDTDDTGERTPDKPSGREWEKVDGERSNESFDGVGRFGTPRTSAKYEWSERLYGILRTDSEVLADPQCIRWFERTNDDGLSETSQQRECGELESGGANRPQNRWRRFPSVSPVHRGNDGIPFDVDCLTLSFGKWRTEALKAYGNAIVPQVMYEIFRAIEMVEK